MSKYVVTGGAGFIGSAIVRGLLREGARHVVVLDNFLTGHEGEPRRSPFRHRLAARRHSQLRRDRPILKGADVVFHEAAIPSVPRSINDPVPSHEINIDGTFNVLRAAAAGGVGRVVYAASSSAYGDTEVLPKVETMTPRPKSPYALQKLVGEYYAQIFASTFGIETVSLRYFNVFGPRQDPSSQYSGVLSLFIKAVVERRSPTIFGDGEQSRDFTYVEDVVDLNLKAARAPGVSGKLYNGGNGGRITLNEAWRLVQQIEGVTIPANYGPPRPGDVHDSQADTPPPPPIWATRRASPSKRDCGSHWHGTKRNRPGDPDARAALPPRHRAIPRGRVLRVSRSAGRTVDAHARPAPAVSAGPDSLCRGVLSSAAAQSVGRGAAVAQSPAQARALSAAYEGVDTATLHREGQACLRRILAGETPEPPRMLLQRLLDSRLGHGRE
jgi:nucleoside-diphosphate-sugar epimerase